MRIPLILCILFPLSISLNAMEKKPYHHVYKDGKFIKFRNFEGAPQRDKNIKWSYRKFSEAKKNINVDVPKGFVIPRETVIQNLEKYLNYPQKPPLLYILCYNFLQQTLYRVRS